MEVGVFGVFGVALGTVVAIAVSGVTEAASLEQATRASSEMAASDEMSVFIIEEYCQLCTVHATVEYTIINSNSAPQHQQVFKQESSNHLPNFHHSQQCQSRNQ